MVVIIVLGWVVSKAQKMVGTLEKNHEAKKRTERVARPIAGHILQKEKEKVQILIKVKCVFLSKLHPAWERGYKRLDER